MAAVGGERQVVISKNEKDAYFNVEVKYWEGWGLVFFFPFCIVCFICYSTENTISLV